MPLTFAQLTAAQTSAQLNALLIQLLQGLGIVTAASVTGGAPAGTGSVTLTGSPAAAYTVVLKITVAGELGTGSFQYSLDAGVSYSGNVTIPVSGLYTLATTGVVVGWAPGPLGSGTSFVLGDTYTFALSVPSFPTNSWQPGSVPRTLVAIEAQALASVSNIIGQIASGGLVNYSTGPWLDLLASNVYQLTRAPASATIGAVVLTDAQSAGPFTIGIGQLIVASTSGQQYQNSTGGTLNKAGTLSLSFQALLPGSGGNVANAAITTLATPLPGVTVNNPDPGGGTWITTTGVDAESDTSLQQRCILRWPSLGIGATSATYDYWVRNTPSVASLPTRTFIQTDPVVAGQVRVYFANSAGAPAGGDVTLVQAYINTKEPLDVNTIVAGATNVNVTVTATIYYKAALTTLAIVTAACSTAINAVFTNGQIGIDNTPTLKIYVSQVIGALQNVAGVRNVVVSAPAVDVNVLLGQVAILQTYTPTFTAV